MTSTLTISGMTCASCVAHVSRALRSVPGVTEAAVNLATEEATVRHDGVGPEQLVRAVERAGYEASVVAPAADGAAPNDDGARRAAELRRARRLLAVAVVLTVPATILGMGVPAFAGKDWVMLALTVPVWAVVGWEFHRGALAQARHGAANMDTLVSLGSTAALGYSIFATFAGQPAYYETSAAIVTLIFVGTYLEAAARGKSDTAMRALLALRPIVARRVAPDGSISEVSIDDVRAGDVLQVPAGERIAVDGVVVDGRSAIDASMLTGEPLPVDAGPGTAVHAGTVNADGTLHVRATAVGAGTMLARILEIVRAAQGSTPPVQRLADRVAAVFVPAILGIAVLSFAGWIVSGHPWPQALAVAVAVVVVACPCALGLATPTAIVAAVGAGARAGVLFKDAAALERLSRVDDVVFDKTGTLTLGHPTLVHVATAPGTSELDVLGIAAALERSSTHPLARAIAAAADERGVAVPAARDVVTQRGAGLRGRVNDDPALVGSAAFLEHEGIATVSRVAPPAYEAATPVWVARGGVALGALELADELRPASAEAIEALRTLGVRTRIVSGDVPVAVAAIARRLGIDDYVAQATPESKGEALRALQRAGRRVAFVGDGINDAPALAIADVGLAMGGGAEVALETAGAAILSNDPRAVAAAIRLSRRTAATIRQNLFWAFAYNIVLVPLAAFGQVQPILAAAAMGLSSLFVVGNSLRLGRAAAGRSGQRSASGATNVRRMEGRARPAGTR